MDQFFRNDSAVMFAVVVTLVAGCVIAWLGYCWYLVSKAHIEATIRQATIRQEMVQRGMSAEEINRVLQPAKPDRVMNMELAYQSERLEAELKFKLALVEQGMSAEDIVRVLQATSNEEAAKNHPVPTLEKPTTAIRG